MEEELINLETAKLAKEVGLTCDKIGQSYRPNGEFTYGLSDEFYPAPTLSLLQKWVRETCQIHIELVVWDDNTWSGQLVGDMFSEETEGEYEAWSCESYEEALETCLVKALEFIKENLID
jgi:hypothetical protein